MRFSAKSATADFKEALGLVVATSRPLAARMMLTVIGPSLGLALPVVAATGGRETNEANVPRLCTVPQITGPRTLRRTECDAKILSRSELNAWLSGRFHRW